jgi:hypothetical protein
MTSIFQGCKDDYAVILSDVFPRSNLMFSTPIDFLGKRSSVYVEGDEKQVEAIFGYLQKLAGVYFDDQSFGRWIGVAPPEQNLSRAIIYYEAYSEIDKIRLLNLVLPRHLAKICNLALRTICNLIVRYKGRDIQKSFVILPEDLTTGELVLSLLEETEEHKKIIFS